MGEYFSHDVDARADVRVSQLIQSQGYEGYGLFWAIIELMNQQTDCMLPLDLKWLAWELHTKVRKLEKVVLESGLFVVSEDKRFFWSESAQRRFAARTGAVPTTKRRGRPPKNLQLRPEVPTVKPDDCENTSKTPQISTNVSDLTNYSTTTENVSQNAKETASEQFPQNNQNAFEDVEPFLEPDCGCGEANVDEKVLTYWNEVFAGTNRVQRGLCLSSDASFRLHKTLEAGYDLDEIKKAISAARRDSYQWYLPAVLKEDNVQRLLTKEARNNDASNDITAGKQYCDSNGVPCKPGAEFVSPEYWNDYNANVETAPF